MDLKPHRTRTISLFIIVLTISSLLIGMEAVRDDDFLHYESAKYSTISQNILRSGDGLNLRDRRTPFEGDHPPLVFWVNAVFIDLLGETVFAAVLFSVICAVLTCAAVFIAGCILENDIVGFFASTGLLLTRYVVRVARFNTVDIPLMFFVTASVLFLLLALKRDKIFYICIFGDSLTCF